MTSSRENLNILVIDDEEDIIMILSEILGEDFDCATENAPNGLEGYHLCQNKKYDFIITDFKMPVMNGGEFIDAIRGKDGPNKSTPIIMLTGYKPEDFEDRDDLVDVFILEKPLDLDKVYDIITEYLEAHKAA